MQLEGIFNSGISLKEGNTRTVTFTPNVGKTYSNYLWSIRAQNFRLIYFTTSGNSITVFIPNNYIPTGRYGSTIYLVFEAEGECSNLRAEVSINIIKSAKGISGGSVD